MSIEDDLRERTSQRSVCWHVWASGSIGSRNANTMPGLIFEGLCRHVHDERSVSLFSLANGIFPEISDDIVLAARHLVPIFRRHSS